jgi:hypothetical protein
MMRNGRLYRLKTLERRISGKGSGLWPTPQSRDFRSGQAERVGRDGKQNNLNDYVKLWPTPDVRGFTNQGSLKMLASVVEDKQEFMGMGYRANAKKKEGLWSTPKAGDAVMGMTARTSGRPIEKSTHLQTQVYLAEQRTGGQLNPAWVEVLMGYPAGWTNLED